MLTAFWSGLGGDLAKRWAARVLTPAVAFWAAGLAIVWWHLHSGSIGAYGLGKALRTSSRGLTGLPVFDQVLLLAGGLAVLAVSALAAERLTTPLLRFLEGYWTRPGSLRRALVTHRRNRRRAWDLAAAPLRTRQRMGSLTPAEYLELDRLEQAPPADTARLRELRAKRAAGLDQRQSAELGRDLMLLHRTPRTDDLGMPTRLGDILRAAERRPLDKYGLDTAVCWYALWLVLPKNIRTELVGARTALDNAARGCLWGALFVVWTPLAPWAPAVAIGVPVILYYGVILSAATQFGELMVAAFDLHRFALYDSLHLPRPKAPATERADGRRVTNLLWGGLDEPGLEFADGK